MCSLSFEGVLSARYIQMKFFASQVSFAMPIFSKGLRCGGGLVVLVDGNV